MIDNSAPAFLQTANKFGIKLGLSRMSALMDKLSHPEKHFRAFHIAGTNGKGSVSAYCAAMLAWDGQKVGLYTSPFLERFSERIRILDGREGLLLWEKNDSEGEIDQESLSRLSALVEEKVKELLEEGEEHPTEFELVTAVAFLYFAEKHCDVVVLETGLGGRLDSTNVIKKPEASLITALGYDHMDRLGNTLGKIAAEKGGIIKDNCPVFALDTHQSAVSEEEAKEAAEVLLQIAEEKHAPLTWVSPDSVKRIDQDLHGQDFLFEGQTYHIRMHGGYQLENAALALTAMKNFVTAEARKEGLAHTMWKGRLEAVSEEPPVILDGAHNPQGITSFVEFTRELPSLRHMPPCEVIMGVMADKDVSGMLSILIENWRLPIERITLVTPNQKRAMPAEELKAAWEQALRASKAFYNSESCMYNAREKLDATEDPELAAKIAIDRAKRIHSPVYVIGSLYLLGEIRGAILAELEKE